MSLRTVLAAAILAAAPMPALAQGAGYGGGVPPNPFASNYPSAPPPVANVERRERRAVRRPSRGPAPLPPGRIPR